MVAVLAATVFLLTARQEVLNNPAAALSLVLVAATVVLILVMCTLTIVFRRLRIQDKSQPMGLPRGSVRAVIALLLITLFFIVAIFLFSSTQNRADPDQTRALNGVSADRVADIPTEEIKDMTDRVVDGTTVYDLVLFLPSASTTTSDDIAKQLVTTVGTLVTAVAAFYFGANTVAGAAAKNNGLQVPPIVPPAGPEVLKPAGTATDPAEQAAAKAEAEQAAADQAAADQAAADQAAVDEAVAEEQAAAESDADATAVSGDVVTDASPPDEPAEPPDAASKSVG
jgi:amino acid transporter